MIGNMQEWLEINSERSDIKDWGDGYHGTIRGIAKKYRMCDGTLFHRVMVLGYSMKDALSMPNGNTEYYWKIGGNYYLKKDLCTMVGTSQVSVTGRLSRGIPIEYAIIPNRFKTGTYKKSIFILNGEAYWWSDLKEILQVHTTKSPDRITTTGTDLKEFLLEKSLLTENDYFKEITF